MNSNEDNTSNNNNSRITTPIQKGEELWKTEVIDNNLNPQWKPFILSIGECCGNSNTNGQVNPDIPISIECYDHDAVGSNDLIGRVEVSGYSDLPKYYILQLLSNPFSLFFYFADCILQVIVL